MGQDIEMLALVWEFRAMEPGVEGTDTYWRDLVRGTAAAQRNQHCDHGCIYTNSWISYRSTDHHWCGRVASPVWNMDYPGNQASSLDWESLLSIPTVYVQIDGVGAQGSL